MATTRHSRYVPRTEKVCKVHASRLALLCCVAGWRSAHGWGLDGHVRIAKVARDILKEKEQKQVKSYMHGDLVTLSGWESQMTKKFSETQSLHWHRQEPEWTCSGSTTLGDQSGHIKCDGHGAENGSLFCALAYFFEHFAHDALLNDFPAPKEPINTPTSLPALAKMTDVEHKPSHYLRWLVVLIGDLHQPLHWLREKNYGKEVKLEYKGLQYNLLDFWEDYIPKNLPPAPEPKVLQKQYEDKAPGWWDKLPAELFRDWAKEVAAVVCGQVYDAMAAAPLVPASTASNNGTNGTNLSASVYSGPPVYKLEEEVFQRWLKLAQDFTILGGQRLAYVLHEIIEHKKHKAHAKEGRGRHHRKRSWWKCMGINAIIAAFVAPLIMSLLRWHDRAGGPGLMWLAKKHLKM